MSNFFIRTEIPVTTTTQQIPESRLTKYEEISMWDEDFLGFPWNNSKVYVICRKSHRLAIGFDEIFAITSCLIRAGARKSDNDKTFSFILKRLQNVLQKN